MPYCPKCGSEVDETMAFCSKCGTSLKGSQYEDIKDRAKAEIRDAKREWREERRRMREERWNRYGGGMFRFIGPLIGGIILVLLGLAFYLQVVEGFGIWFFISSFFIIMGILVIVIGIYVITVLTRR